MTHEAAQPSLGLDRATPTIFTPRLALIEVMPEMLRADFAKSSNFSDLIDAQVPLSWPPDGWDEDAYNYLLQRMEGFPHFGGWSRYILIKAAAGKRSTLAGGCGLLDPVELNDDPEIGYGLLPEFQGLGYATEAVAALIDWIFQHSHVRSINAQTLPDHQRSLRVLTKHGFEPAGPGREPGTVLFRKWRVAK